MSAAEPVNVKLLDREFLVACAPEERAGLLAAAALIDGKMREIRANAKAPGFDRIAVLAALGVAHELLELRRQHDAQARTLSDGLGALRRKLEGALPSHLK